MKTKLDLVKPDREKAEKKEGAEKKDKGLKSEKAPKSEKSPPSASVGEERKVSKIRGRLPVKFMTIGVAGLVLLLGGLGAAGYMGYVSIPGFSPAHSSPPPPPSPPVASDPQEIGPLVRLSPLIINLKEGSGRSYLKATIILEIGKKDRVEEVQSRMPELVDTAILTLCDKRMEDLMQPDCKSRLKGELLAKVNQLFGSPWVRRIYFDEFIYQ
jgi:flagellar basal body-associated protein FliL